MGVDFFFQLNLLPPNSLRSQGIKKIKKNLARNQTTLHSPQNWYQLFLFGSLQEGNVPKKEEEKRTYHSEPYNAPTHAGGLFAIDREWFKELGWYDPGEINVVQ